MQTLSAQVSPSMTTRKVVAFVVCFLCYVFGGTVSTVLSAYLPVAIPELLGKAVSQAELGRIGAYLNSGFLYGWMLGGLAFGAISDRTGRVKALAFSVFLYGLFTVLIVSVTSWQLLLVYRFIAGIGVGGVLLISTVYIAEIWDTRQRPVALGILAVAFPVGIVLTGGVTVQLGHWKQAFWVGILPILLAVAAAFLKESQQWKASGKPPGEVQANGQSGLYRRNLLIGIVVFGSVLIGLWATFSWIPTWVQTLVSPDSDGQKERGLVMMLLGTGGIAGGIASGFLIRGIGIRYTLTMTFLGCVAACWLLFINTAFSPIIYVETALLSLFFGISQGSLSSYIPSLFPAYVRGAYTGFCFNVGRFFTATAVFFVGALVNLLGGLSNSLLVFSFTFLVALIMVFLTIKKDSKADTV